MAYAFAQSRILAWATALLKRPGKYTLYTLPNVNLVLEQHFFSPIMYTYSCFLQTAAGRIQVMSFIIGPFLIERQGLCMYYIFDICYMLLSPDTTSLGFRHAYGRANNRYGIIFRL